MVTAIGYHDRLERLSGFIAIVLLHPLVPCVFPIGGCHRPMSDGSESAQRYHNPGLRDRLFTLFLLIRSSGRGGAHGTVRLAPGAASALVAHSRPWPGVRERQRETEFHECSVILSIRNDTSVDLEIMPAESAIRPIQYQSHEISRTLDAHLDEALEERAPG